MDKRKYFITTIFILTFFANLFAQTEEPNPFDRWRLNQHYDTNQVNFSKEFLKARGGKLPIITYELKRLNCSPAWLRQNSQDGVLGNNYQRIKIKLLSVKKDETNPLSYSVTGKSKVKNNITDFFGKIEIIKVLDDTVNEDTSLLHGIIFSKYSFWEDSTKMYSGLFEGIVETLFMYDLKKNEIYLDTLMDVADGYSNNTFVGTWTDYKTKKSKKCIWGEYRLPFTFDFDVGDGEMVINERYRKNGWETFNDFDKEWTFIKEGFSVEKNKWWIK
jgi:hypothetical protein